MRRSLRSYPLLAAAGPAILVCSLSAMAQESEYAMVAVTVAGEDTGEVVLSPNASYYAVGDWVTLAAVPAAGYRFERWTGDVTAYDAVLTVVVTGDLEITANFAPDLPETCSLTLIADPSGAGTIVLDPFAEPYVAGTQVTITAIAADGFVFETWGGDLAERVTDITSPVVTISVDGDLDVAANFAAAALVRAQGPAASGLRWGGALCGSMGLIGLGLSMTALIGWRWRRR